MRALVVAALLVGCGDAAIVQPAFRPVSTPPPGTRWTGGVTLVADNQEFHIGHDSFLFRSGFTDRHASRSAVRVPQQDLFGDALLELATASSRMAVHLGDACDLSCTDEWRDFVQTMNASGSQAWFWTPGNHDGFFFGNFAGRDRQWRSACAPGAPLTKDLALRRYLDQHLAAYTGASLAAAAGAHACPDPGRCRGLRQVRWDVPAAYHRAYVVQELELPRDGGPAVSLILIDTSTFDRPPDLRAAAGEQGRIGPAQLAIVEAWTATARAAGRTVVLAGHHPFDDLDPASRAGIERLVASRRATTYISAHTHHGSYRTHASADGTSWLEPNIGSVLDYDTEYATLSIGAAGDRRLVRVARSSPAAFANGARVDLGIQCKPTDWLARPADADFYTRYMASTSVRPATLERAYFATLLAALERYWRCVPTLADDVATAPIDARVGCVPTSQPCAQSSAEREAILGLLARGDTAAIRDKAVALLAADRTRRVDACRRREYRACQALWAAEYEHRQFLTPQRGQDTFEIHTPTRTEGPPAP